jgi:DNA repair exonuclease SbcCD nuclease subunit
MKKLDSNIIIMADIHFGLKRFNISVLKNQISVFIEQIIPYMKENNIKQIFQLGDIFDNRTSVDIVWLDTIKKEFFDNLRDEGLELFTLKGNHDIALRESLDIALIDTISDIYDNVHVFSEREYLEMEGSNSKIYVVPWMTKNEKLTKEEISDVDYIFGHFEVRNFSMVPGIVDTTSELTEGFFKENKRLKGVFSGHYHLKNIKGLMKYLGSLTQINWSDYNDMKGFYHFDGFSLNYIENIISKKYIKVKYNDDKNTDKNIEVKGLYEYSIMLTNEEFDNLLPVLKKHEIKTFINKHKDDSYEEILYKMKKADISTSVINNQELSEIIGTDYIVDETTLDQKDTKSLIIDTLKENREDLLPLLNKLLLEIQTDNIEG